MKKKIVGLVVIITTLLGMLLTIVLNWKYIFRSQKYYSQNELDKKCEDSYKQGVKDSSDENLFEKISQLTLRNEELKKQNDLLSAERESLTTKVAENEALIIELNKKKDELTQSNENHEEEINNLNLQISELETQNNEYKISIAEKDSTIEENNKLISELQNSVANYQEFIASLENETEVVAMFVLDGELWNIQKCNKNGLAYLENNLETNEDYIFYGWKVNNEIVDLSTYTLSCNTTFVADVLHLYDVNFVVDGETFNSQVVEENDSIVVPSTPTKDGYEFDGWTIDGVNIIDLTTYSVNKDVTFTAVFTKVHTATFISDEETISTQSIRNGGFVENVEIESTPERIFNGWSVDGVIVDLSTYKMVEDTTFISSYTMKYQVTYKDGDDIYLTEYYENNSNLMLPVEPIKTGYTFKGWSIDGVEIIDLTNYQVTSNIEFIALYISNMVGTYKINLDAVADPVGYKISFKITLNADNTINLSSVTKNEAFAMTFSANLSNGSFDGLTCSFNLKVSGKTMMAASFEQTLKITYSNNTLNISKVSGANLTVLSKSITKV